MEKTNSEIIVETLKVKSFKYGELETKTQIPKTTLFRTLKNLIDDKVIKKDDDGFYNYIQPTPSIKDIYDTMFIHHQQKLMDNKYRKLKVEGKADEVLRWYIDNTSTLKGRIVDYDFDKLLNHITKAVNMLKQSI